jgi:hypothetical protein
MVLDKKQAKAEYRDRPLDSGILLISFAGSDQSFLFPTRDIKSTQNKLRFTLEMGNCTHKNLQSAWNSCGEDSLHFALIERYEPDGESTDVNITEDLRALLQLVASEHPQSVVIEPARI